MDLKKFIVDVKDFPIEGIVFKDITPLLNDVQAFKYTVDAMAKIVKQAGVDVIVAPEARGFLFASAVAYVAGCRFVLVRKPGKLPREVLDIEYSLEYGTGHIQMHKGDLKPGDKVAILDDVLATGGTMQAIIDLTKKCQADIKKIVFLADLSFLHDADIFKEYNPESLITY